MFFLRKKIHKKTVFDILDRKECFSDLRSEVLPKSRKSTFCIGVISWFLSKKSTFFLYVFFFSKKRKKQTVFDILDRKECCLDLKSEVLKSRENRHFAKGFVHGFCQKIHLFLICFF